MPALLTHFPEGFHVKKLQSRSEPRKVLMCSPLHFDIVDVKNVHMEGQQGALDKLLAQQQWESLCACYESLVKEGVLEGLYILKGEPGLEDMVFCANQTFPWVTADGKKQVVMSKMRHASRQREVPFFEQFFKAQGYEILHLQRTGMFEGMGDCIPHPGRRLLYGGYGHRTLPDAYTELGELLDVPVIPLELVDERFYHLDTCFLPVDEETLLLCPDAFSGEGLRMLRQCFQNLVEIPSEEAASTFSLNAHVCGSAVAEKTALIQPGSIQTRDALRRHHCRVIETETGEFMKSGGSVFCMKMMFY